MAPCDPVAPTLPVNPVAPVVPVAPVTPIPVAPFTPDKNNSQLAYVPLPTFALVSITNVLPENEVISPLTELSDSAFNAVIV